MIRRKIWWYRKIFNTNFIIIIESSLKLLVGKFSLIIILLLRLKIVISILIELRYLRYLLPYTGCLEALTQVQVKTMTLAIAAKTIIILVVIVCLITSHFDEIIVLIVFLLYGLKSYHELFFFFGRYIKLIKISFIEIFYLIYGISLHGLIDNILQIISDKGLLKSFRILIHDIILGV